MKKQFSGLFMVFFLFMAVLSLFNVPAMAAKKNVTVTLDANNMGVFNKYTQIGVDEEGEIIYKITKTKKFDITVPYGTKIYIGSYTSKDEKKKGYRIHNSLSVTSAPQDEEDDFDEIRYCEFTIGTRGVSPYLNEKKDGSGKKYSGTITVKKNLTLYLAGEKTDICSLTLDATGGYIMALDELEKWQYIGQSYTKYIRKGAKVNVATFLGDDHYVRRKGWKFLGWSTDASASSPEVYAMEEDSYGYTHVYDPDTGSTHVVEDPGYKTYYATVPFDENYELTYEELGFGGTGIVPEDKFSRYFAEFWSEKYPVSYFNLNSDITYYAIWEKEAETPCVHNWSAAYKIVEPGCNTRGKNWYYCKHCFETKTEDIPAQGHDWSSWVYQAAQKIRICSKCNAKESVPLKKPEVKANKNSLRLTSLKKKAQTVTVSVKGSTGKISISNRTAKGNLKKWVKAKVNQKDGTVTLTFKKNTPKGTFTFAVKVDAKDDYRELTRTITVRVR